MCSISREKVDPHNSAVNRWRYYTHMGEQYIPLAVDIELMSLIPRHSTRLFSVFAHLLTFDTV